MSNSFSFSLLCNETREKKKKKLCCTSSKTPWTVSKASWVPGTPMGAWRTTMVPGRCMIDFKTPRTEISDHKCLIESSFLLSRHTLRAFICSSVHFSFRLQAGVHLIAVARQHLHVHFRSLSAGEPVPINYSNAPSCSLANLILKQ